ncbi:MAG: SUMF1/EgtB/PvdO family nonheme iron enzyme [Actinomycetota bacterium]
MTDDAAPSAGVEATPAPQVDSTGGLDAGERLRRNKRRAFVIKLVVGAVGMASALCLAIEGGLNAGFGAAAVAAVVALGTALQDWLVHSEHLSKRQARQTAGAALVVGVTVFLLCMCIDGRSKDQQLLDDVLELRSGTSVALATEGSAVSLDGVWFPQSPGDPEGELGTGSAPIGAFELDRFEVPVEQYRLCMMLPDEEYRCPTPADGGAHALQDASRLPVVGVDAAAAFRFCAWVGARLPSDDEWLFAARGDAGRSWAWLEDEAANGVDAREIASNANVAGAIEVGRIDEDEPLPDLALPPLLEIDARPSARTPDTAIDHLLGNVWEWTATSVDYSRGRIWQPGGDARSLMLRGHSFTSTADGLEMFQFLDLPVDATATDIGFRCARSIQTEDTQ